MELSPISRSASICAPQGSILMAAGLVTAQVCKCRTRFGKGRWYARSAGSTRVSELAADVGPEHRAIVCQRHEQEQAFLESRSQRHAPRE